MVLKQGHIWGYEKNDGEIDEVYKCCRNTVEYFAMEPCQFAQP